MSRRTRLRLRALVHEWRLRLALLLLSLVALLLVGCGSALSTAQTSTIRVGEAIGVAGQALDHETPRLTQSLHDQARAAHPDDPGAAVEWFDDHAEILTAAADAVDVAEQAWLAQVAALKAWASSVGDEASWQRAAACAVASLARAAHALAIAGVELPAQVQSVASAAQGFAEQMCGTSSAQGGSS